MNRRKISFDGWILDRESGDLSRGGNRQRLQELPLKVLDLLLASPGRLVTREEFIAHLWPKGVVDFDTGLNTAVRKLRVALADVADAPRYLETIPRRGYRFVGTIDPDPPSAAEPIPVPFVAPPIKEPASGGEKQSVEGGDPVAPSFGLPELARDTAPKPRRRLFLGIAATLALCMGAMYWLSHRAATSPAATSSVPAVALPDQSVAVLPFESLSTEPNNEFLAIGIAETVLHRLASLHDLTVIARTSSFVFKNRNQDTRQIGRALNARYLLEGSVQRAGERLRVHAQLIDAASGKQLWSLAFDRPLADIFALQDEISSRVADQLSVSLTPATLPPTDTNTSHLDAYLSYLQGRALISTSKIADAKLAIQYFARAVQMDPRFAAAYAQESRAITHLAGLQERNDPEDLKRAIVLNDWALTLSPQLGEAWVQRAGLLLDASGDKETAEAEKAFRQGLALAPNYGHGFEQFSDFLFSQNHLDEALIMIERARQVDPLMPRNHYLKAVMLDEAGRDAGEIESLYLQALKLNPTYHPALVRLGWWYSWQGEYARGLMLQEKAVGIEPEAIWVRAAAAASYLTIGDLAAAEDLLSTEQGRGSGMKICVLMLSGDHAAAVRKAYELFGVGHSETLSPVQLCAAAEMLRDALATRRFDRALHVMESQYAVHAGNLGDAAHTAFVWGLPLAQLLLAKGDTVRGNRLAQSILATSDQDSKEPGYKTLLLIARAGALGVLGGDHDRALDALEDSVSQGLHVMWWIFDLGHTFDRFKQDDRYKTLAAAVSERVRKQAELVAKMREAHELPRRPANVVSAN
jgi:TolB-like protein/DNA-binding winged helix-turn-helix (wHTH) protein